MAGKSLGSISMDFMNCFYQMNLYKTTPEGCEKLDHRESGEEEEDDMFPCPPQSTIREEPGNDSDLDEPVWDFGIRRSDSSKDRDLDEVALSDIILDPDGNVAYYWLGVVTIAVVYNIAVIVLRLAFEDLRFDTMQDAVFYPLDTFSDLIFILDIFVSFRISFFRDGCLVLDPVKIGEHYRRSTKFKTDLMAILPVGTVYNLLTGVKSLFLGTPHVSGDICTAIVRMPRLLKYPTMSKFFDLTDSRTRNPTMVRATKLTFNLWIVIHWIACFYYMVSEYEGLGTNEWVYPNGTEYNPLHRKYVRVMYWSLMTLTTIGERPAPETDLEYVFTGFTFLIGVFVFAAVVGNVGDVISNMNAARQEFQSRMDQIKSYLQHRNVPEKIQHKVKRWADYTWTRTQAVDEPTLLQMLPDRLRSEIAINVHLDTLKKVKIFEECEEGLLRELVLKLRSQVFSPGDYICRIGEIGKEMYIVNHGRVEILVPNGLNGHRTVVATLQPGNYFGEISLLKLDEGHNRRTADVRAIGFSELLRLSRKDLMLALVEYPNAKRILESQAIERMHKTKEVRSACGTDIHTPAEPAYQEDKQLKKNDLLLQVVKSNNFQKLLTSRRNKDVYISIDEIEFQPDPTTDYRVTCPIASEKSIYNAVNTLAPSLLIGSSSFLQFMAFDCKDYISYSTPYPPESETAELRSVLSELKQFDSQTTKNKLERLQSERDALESQLQEMKKELDSIKLQKQHNPHGSSDFDNRSTLNVNGQLRLRRRRRSSSGLLRTCHTCNKYIDKVETKSADESEAVYDIPANGELNSLNVTAKDNVKCKHHALKKRLFMHSHSSPNLLNKSSVSPRNPVTSANDTTSERRLSKIIDIPDINVTDMSETEKTDNESNTLNVLEGILALESDTGLSEMDDNSDKSSDDDNDI